MSKQALGNFETPKKTPEDLEQALERRDSRAVRKLLENEFEKVAGSKYEWLHELVDVGYSWKDIADLLLEEANDAPWIYCDPRDRLAQDSSCPAIMPEDAVKNWVSRRRQMINENPVKNAFSNSPWMSKRHDVKRIVQRLCGLGGIVPYSRSSQDWNGEVIFEDNFSTSYISYSTSSDGDRNDRLSQVILRLKQVLRNFCEAVTALQGAELCLDYFTVAQIRTTQNISARDVELIRVHVDLATELHQKLDRLPTTISSYTYNIEELLKTASMILYQSRVFYEPSPIFDFNEEDILHLCCLAAQFLCVGLVSFCQGHIGPMDSIFTNHSQERSVLLGSQYLNRHKKISFPHIAVRLAKLTCLSEMTEGPLITFGFVDQQQVMSWEWRRIVREAILDENATKISRLGLVDFFADESLHNVVATPGAILYTWGPGELVPYGGGGQWLQYIHVGGGVICYSSDSDNSLHWEAGSGTKKHPEENFSYDEMITVGAPVTKNLAQCSFDWKTWRSSCPLVHLAVRPERWTINQRQLGLQIGPDHVAFQGMQVWSKTPAKLLKEYQLQQGDSGLMEFLGCYVGVQVSCCTGVARRISIQELLSDLMPKFCITHIGAMNWNVWNTRYDIVSGLCGKDVREWLFKLRRSSPGAYNTLLEHFHRILEVLEPTGLNREWTHIKIAWPKEGDLHRGIKVSCEDKHLWAQVLADSEEGVTFAYMTTTCLVCEDSSCPPKSQESKRTVPKCLGTAVTLYRNEVEEEDNVASSGAPWTLQNGQSYHMWNEKRCIRLKANASLQSSQQYRLMASESAIPSHILKRHFRSRRLKRNLLKEKHHPDDAAVDVLISDERRN